MTTPLVHRVRVAIEAPPVAGTSWVDHRDALTAVRPCLDALVASDVELRDHDLRAALTGRRHGDPGQATFEWAPQLAARRLGRVAVARLIADRRLDVADAVSLAMAGAVGRLAAWLGDLEGGALAEVHAQAQRWGAIARAHLPVDVPGMQVLAFDPALRPFGRARGPVVTVVSRIDAVVQQPSGERVMVVLDVGSGLVAPHLTLARLALAATAGPVEGVGRAHRIVVVRVALGDVWSIDRGSLDAGRLADEVVGIVALSLGAGAPPEAGVIDVDRRGGLPQWRVAA